jgi:hypothetical protein
VAVSDENKGLEALAARDNLRHPTGEHDEVAALRDEVASLLRWRSWIVTTLLAALDGDGWKPERGLHELIDRVLSLRDERDRLRTQCAYYTAFQEGVFQRNKHAEAEVVRLRAELEQVRAERDEACVELVRERGDTVAFLRETLATSETASASDDLDYAIAMIERGAHRREEGA